MKKVFFLIITFILGIFVGYIGYNSAQFTHLNDLVTEAIEEERYAEIAKIFGGCCDTEPLVVESTDNVDMALFAGTSIVELTYNEERYYQYEPTYYLYMFNCNFSYITYNENLNNTALVFSDGVNEVIYPFVVNDNINSSYYVENRTTKDQAILNGLRDVTSNINNWGFMYVNITKSMVESLNNNLNGITSIKLIDNEGKDVVDTSITLDFNQDFFNYIEELVANYNIWLTAYEEGSDNVEAEKKFNEFYEPWLEKFEAEKETTGYSFPYDKAYLTPVKLIWKTVGMLSIYGAMMMGFYIIFFKIDRIKEILTRRKVAKAKMQSKNNKQK